MRRIYNNRTSASGTVVDVVVCPSVRRLGCIAVVILTRRFTCARAARRSLLLLSPATGSGIILVGRTSRQDGVARLSRFSTTPSHSLRAPVVVVIKAGRSSPTGPCCRPSIDAFQSGPLTATTQPSTSTVHGTAPPRSVTSTSATRCLLFRISIILKLSFYDRDVPLCSGGAGFLKIFIHHQLPNIIDILA